MKKLYRCLIIVFSLSACKKDPSELLVGRWDFTRVEIPGMENFLDEIKQSGDNEATTLKKFVLASKLILRKDSTFDLVMLKQYMHGSWQYDKESKNLFLTDSSAAALSMTIRIDSINANELIFDIDQFALNKLVKRHADYDNAYHLLLDKSYCQFYLDADKDKYSNMEDDPYSVVNNRWRVKPAQAETDKQIKERVLNHLDFWENLFSDAQEYDRPYISYGWFDSPLVVAINGVRLEFYDEHKLEWDQHFYDSAQANKGYEMMRKCFRKKLIYLKTENKYRRQEDMIKQLRTNYLEGNGIKLTLNH